MRFDFFQLDINRNLFAESGTEWYSNASRSRLVLCVREQFKMAELSQDSLAKANSLLEMLLSKAESQYGPRDPDFNISKIDQRDDGPRIYIDGCDVTVAVGPYAFTHEPNLLANLAHETVHLLDPKTGYATYLEEGVALDFSLQELRRTYGDSEGNFHREHFNKQYKTAIEDFETLVALNPEAPRAIREKFGKWSKFSADDIVDVAEGIERGVAVRLARECKPR